jgi:hypothetical protein
VRIVSPVATRRVERISELVLPQAAKAPIAVRIKSLTGTRDERQLEKGTGMKREM